MLSIVLTVAVGQHAEPGKVIPVWPLTYDMARSTAMMVCNNSGPVDAHFAAKWGLVGAL